MPANHINGHTLIIRDGRWKCATCSTISDSRMDYVNTACLATPPEAPAVEACDCTYSLHVPHEPGAVKHCVRVIFGLLPDPDSPTPADSKGAEDGEVVARTCIRCRAQLDSYSEWCEECHLEPRTLDPQSLTVLAVGNTLDALCNCGVPEGDTASDPKDRSVLLPHHYECAAVEAWPAVASLVAAREAEVLREAAEVLTAETKSPPYMLSDSAQRVWMGGMDAAVRIVYALHARAAGESGR